MSETIDLMLGCHLYPHTDFYERGQELMELTADLLSGSLQVLVAHVSRKRAHTFSISVGGNDTCTFRA